MTSKNCVDRWVAQARADPPSQSFDSVSSIQSAAHRLERLFRTNRFDLGYTLSLDQSARVRIGALRAVA
jgi:hypothetical protein